MPGQVLNCCTIAVATLLFTNAGGCWKLYSKARLVLSEGEGDEDVFVSKGAQDRMQRCSIMLGGPRELANVHSYVHSGTWPEIQFPSSLFNKG